MLDSNPVKVINLVSSLLTIGGAVGGALTGIDLKGDEWGDPLAATVFGAIFAAIVVLFMAFVTWLYVLIGRLRRECPFCGGSGSVRRGYDDLMRDTHTFCPKCNGEGRIW